MRNIENDYFNILVTGPGKEFLEPVVAEEQETFQNNNLYIGISEGFSAPDVTQVLISIGSNVVAGLSVYYIAKLFDKIFSMKSEAEKKNQKLEVSVSISEKVHIKNIESTYEVEKALEIVVHQSKD